jgi:glycosyltransferase involved in cell wall biosynthesis
MTTQDRKRVRLQGEAGSKPVDVTVLICTRDRAAQLTNVLESAASLRVPDGLRWEILIVDNGSSDNTAEVAMAFRDRLPIRVVRENQAGLSHARNRGVAEAKGTYICWTDDDVLIDPHWLQAYVSAFARHPEAAIFGGEIIPVLEAPTPEWFGKLADRWPLTTLLAKRNFGDKPVRLGFDRGIVPWGANFAVRAAEQRSVRYEPALGVSPVQRRLGEEAEALFRIMKAGGVGWWAPDAKVQHIIPVQRQTLRYVYGYSLSYGETVAYMARTWPGAHHMAASKREMARVKGSVFSLYTRAAINGLLFLAAKLVGATFRSLQFLMQTGFYVGAARIAGTAQAREGLAESPRSADHGIGSARLDKLQHRRRDRVRPVVHH